MAEKVKDSVEYILKSDRSVGLLFCIEDRNLTEGANNVSETITRPTLSER